MSEQGISSNKLLMVIIAILLPPVAVAVRDGLGLHLIINIVLTFLFWIPGLIHALWRVLR
ncbi:MAG: YqaE/Pmp3 family membrane protein [Phycisphaerales bacterium]